VSSELVSGRFVAHVFVEDLDHPEPAPDDAHHLFRVRRLRAGELISVGDGAGRWRPCLVTGAAGAAGAAGAPAGGLLPDGEVVTEPRPQPELTVGFALTKGGRPEWTVQKLTEVGVDRIFALAAERSVVRWDGAEARRHQARWVRVAREAAMQCRRAWLPVVSPVVGFAEAVAGLAGRGALAEVTGRPPSLERPTVLVGPEGGWSDAERGCDLPRVALSGPVLRAETAAVAAGVLLGALREHVVAPVGWTT
jgi:16S rRNA (uracil1498-N3)-methyltransferase